MSLAEIEKILAAMEAARKERKASYKLARKKANKAWKRLLS